MIYQTQALILHKQQHTDNKLIVGMFTQLSGYRSFLCYEGKTQKRYIPMSLVELVGEEKNRSQLGYVKEIWTLKHINQARFDVRKSVISMFLNEILYKTLHNKGQDNDLFDFLYKSIDFLCVERYIADFHLRFLVALMGRLGFCPTNNYSALNNRFNVETSSFEPCTNMNPIDIQVSECLHHFLEEDITSHKFKGILTLPMRNYLLEQILNYYSCHICELTNLQSYPILKEICQ